MTEICNTGWECPRCHNCHAPSVQTCPSCRHGAPGPRRVNYKAKAKARLARKRIRNKKRRR